jgi:hypothetical protein
VVSQLGPTALQSQRTLIQGRQGPLAANQWQLDVAHWWDISLAGAQAVFIDTAYGPTDPEILQSHVPFTTPNLMTLCSSQKIRTTAYSSFNMFGLCFTFVVGTLITVTSYLLEPVSASLQKKRGHGQYGHLEWTTNATLQLQRLAHEEIGLGSWSGGTDAIPVTKARTMLGCLDITNQDRPVLRPPGLGYSSSDPAQSCKETADTLSWGGPEDNNSPPSSWHSKEALEGLTAAPKPLGKSNARTRTMSHDVVELSRTTSTSARRDSEKISVA